jgi:hypothetical protein
MQIMQAAETTIKSKTPSPQKATVKFENVSPARIHEEIPVAVAQMGV